MYSGLVEFGGKGCGILLWLCVGFVVVGVVFFGDRLKFEVGFDFFGLEVFDDDVE